MYTILSMLLQVGDVLAAAGAVTPAAQAFARQAGLCLHQQWWQLCGALLPRLAECHAVLGSVSLSKWCKHMG